MTPAQQPAFKALADPTRRAILTILAEGERSIGDVADAFDMTRPAVKKHLGILEDGGLITVEAQGRERFNALNPDGFRPVLSWLEFFDRFWDDRLTDLSAALDKDPRP